MLQARSDAVYVLATTAATSSEYHETTLTGADTDLLALLLHNCSYQIPEKLFFKPHAKVATTKKLPRTWDID